MVAGRSPGILDSFATNTFANIISACIPTSYSTDISANAFSTYLDRFRHLAAPEAAVAWVGVCLGLEILSNPVTEARDNRKGIAYVLSRMEWYWNLVSLLLDENKAE
ncbi:hypothetical protein CEP51_014089 [Fusarium floridanum]|uniref:NWD NACHT-NTPase N-terminal domain-containing protein n=1 Tax=Fusarium floridanum TaxID=1325733 RepID=A0A428PZ70_9HYPO|nr:hypothetical protein CEP51_014089 [Fusarium floridanum]